MVQRLPALICELQRWDSAGAFTYFAHTIIDEIVHTMDESKFLFIETSEETTSSLATAMSKGELNGIESIRNFLARQTNATDINVCGEIFVRRYTCHQQTDL